MRPGKKLQKKRCPEDNGFDFFLIRTSSAEASLTFFSLRMQDTKRKQNKEQERVTYPLASGSKCQAVTDSGIQDLEFIHVMFASV